MTIATVIAIAQLRLRIQSLSRAAAPGCCVFDTFGTFGSWWGISVTSAGLGDGARGIASDARNRTRA